MVSEPSFPGCVIEARPIGLFRMTDRGQPDEKILAVPANDPISRDYHDITDIPQHFLHEVAHFFAVYKDLEGVSVKTIGWEGAAQARKAILHGVELYQSKIDRRTETSLGLSACGRRGKRGAQIRSPDRICAPRAF